MFKKTEHQETGLEHCQVLWLGGFNSRESRPVRDNGFFKLFPNKKTDASKMLHSINHNEVCFNVYLFENTPKLLYRSLFPKSDFVIIYPESIDDFDNCARIIDTYGQQEASTQVFYLNPFQKSSDQQKIIDEKARFEGYQKIEADNLFTQLSSSFQEKDTSFEKLNV